MLKQAGAEYEERLLPGYRDLSEMFSTPKEYLGDDFQKPCSEEQKRFLRRFKTLFTSGEDNLVLRGVNLYGEKQWILIADRYLPDRTINNISQRYSKLCVMLYKAHGIAIDNNGNLETPPKLESVEDIDDEKVALIKKAAAPAILNVHRWSLEEDLTLLKAVPLMGHMWAELGARLIPHRDRGHLRKRYQVLERRVKATVTRYLKGHDPIAKVAVKMQEKEREQQSARPQQQRQVQPRQQPVSQHHQPAPIPHHLRPVYPPQPVLLAPRVPPAAVSHPATVPQPRPPVAARPLPTSKPPPRPLPTSKPPPRPLPIAAKPKAKPAAPKPSTTQTEMLAQIESANAESSRAAVEELVDDSKGWSQMSRIQEMMEHEFESEIVGTLASRMSKPETPTRKSQRASVKTGPSILTSVLERANQRTAKASKGVKRKNTLPTTRTSKRLAAAAEAKQTKEFPAIKSPLLARTSSPPRASKRASSPANAGAGSPDVNSALFAGNSETLDGIKFDDLESRGANESYGVGER